MMIRFLIEFPFFKGFMIFILISVTFSDRIKMAE